MNPRSIAAVLILSAAAFATSACGSDEPTASTTVEQTVEAAPEVPEVAVTTTAEIGEAAAATEGVSVYIVAAPAPNSYGVQFAASPTFEGSWYAPAAQFSGVNAAGETVALVDDTMWPENPTVGGGATYVGGTLVFAGPVVEVVYTARDGSTVAWTVA